LVAPNVSYRGKKSAHKGPDRIMTSRPSSSVEVWFQDGISTLQCPWSIDAVISRQLDYHQALNIIPFARRNRLLPHAWTKGLSSLETAALCVAARDHEQEQD
jgi:hypothetical protein